LPAQAGGLSCPHPILARSTTQLAGGRSSRPMGTNCSCNEERKESKSDLVEQDTYTDGQDERKHAHEADPILEESRQPEEAPASEVEVSPAPPPKELSGPKLTVAIVAVRGLRNADWTPGSAASNCYCVLKIAGKDQEHTTKVQSNTLEPIWKQEFQVPDWSGHEDLEFTVFEGSGATPSSLGKATLQSEKFEQGFNGEVKLDSAVSIFAFLKVKVKMPDQDYPAASPTEFSFTVEKDPSLKQLGLDLDPNDGRTLFVTDIRQGPFLTYNETAADEVKLRKGDFIVRINGVEANAEMLIEQFKKESRFEVLVKRPMEVRAVIDRTSIKAQHGMDFFEKPGIGSLLVTNVSLESAAADWNQAHEEASIKAGDRIVEVKGKRGRGTELLKHVKASAAFHMVLVRATATDDPAFWWAW